MTAPAMPARETSRATAPVPAIAPWLTARMRAFQLHTQLVTERSSFISHWQQINKVLFPRRGQFVLTDANKGDRRNKDIIDSTATFAARTLAAGMMSGITSPARRWFRLTTPDPDTAELASVKDWLQQVTQRLETILLKSNFYDAAHVMYGDLGVYGTSPMLVEEDDEDVIRCHVFPIGSYCLGNDEKGRARVFTREYPMTVRQMVRTFGYDQCSAQVQHLWTQNQTESWWYVVHVLDANEGYAPGYLQAKYKRYRSCYFERGGTMTANPQPLSDRFLRESGYDEFPLLVARWDVAAGDAYATDCPGMTALGDILQLQFGAKKGLQALEKHVSPALVAPTSLQNKAISQIPGGVTFDDSEHLRGLRPLHEVKPDLDKLMLYQNQTREMIREAFYADLFRLNSYLDEMGGKQPKTAAEIGERKEEKLLALGPVLERTNKDCWHTLIDRVFAIALRRGLIPPAPPELHGVELKVEYISIMHAAQKAGGLGQLERFATFAVQLAMATQDPSKLDKVDTDQSIDEYADMAGVPPRVVRSDDAVKAIRDGRAKAAAQQQQVAALKDASQGAKNLSQSDTSGKNALTDLLSQVGAPLS